MALTTAQLQALKADIQADGTLSAMWAAGNPGQIANAYNQTASPDFYVWRSSISFKEILSNFIDADWTAMDNLTVGQDRIWINLRALDMLDMSSAAHRAAVTECWKGTAAKVAVKDRIFGMSSRLCNRVEKLFATGTGTTVSPAVLGFEGQLGWQDINAAMES